MTSWRICHAFGWQYDFCSRHQTRSYIRECSVPELSGGSKKEGPKGRRGWSYNKVASSVEGSINRECTVCISLPTLPASLVPQTVKNLPAARETRVWSLDWEDPMEKGMATHSSILAWEIPWTEEPGGLQPMGSQFRLSDWATNTATHRDLKYNTWVCALIFELLNLRKWRLKRSVV